MPDLSSLTVAVTGAAGGIGSAAVARLIADGARVAAMDLDAAAAQRVLDDIGVPAGRAVALSCDVGDEDSVARAFADAAAILGPVTGLFANAGIGPKGPLHEMALGDWERTLRVNLTGVFLSIKHALPTMMAAGRGAIVTTGSISSVVASPGGAVSYKASKAGVNLMTKSVAVEYAAHGIRANCVCPGSVATEFAGTAHAPAAGPTPVSSRAPLRRKAEPEEIASVVAFLLSDEASYVTGATIMADGGFTAG